MNRILFKLVSLFFILGFVSDAAAKPVDSIVFTAKKEADDFFYSDRFGKGIETIKNNLIEAERKFGEDSIEAALLRHMIFVKSYYSKTGIFKKFYPEEINQNSKIIKAKLPTGRPEILEAELLNELLKSETANKSKMFLRLIKLSQDVFENGGDKEFAYDVLFSVSSELRNDRKLEISDRETRIKVAQKLVAMAQEILMEPHTLKMQQLIYKAYLVRGFELSFAGTDFIPGIFMERSGEVANDYYSSLIDIKKYRLLIGDTSKIDAEAHFKLVALENFVRALFLDRSKKIKKYFDVDNIKYSQGEEHFINPKNFYECPNLLPSEMAKIHMQIPEDISDISMVVLYDVFENKAINLRLVASFEPGFESNRPMAILEKISNISEIKTISSNIAACDKDRILVITLINPID